MKTGYTSAAQNTLVAAAKENGRVLIAVLLKCKEREDIFKDAITLFDAAFSEQKKRYVYLDPGPSLLCFARRKETLLQLYTVSPLEVVSYPSELRPLKAVVQLHPLTLPIQPSEDVGTVSLRDSEGNILERWLYSIK